MPDPDHCAPASAPETRDLENPLPLVFKRILAGNPFYLISAGLLLYGINQLTTDPKLIGSEFFMLQFNFCALLAYELMVVGTAIALIRRAIWYDALLLFGLTNLFIIVPFSLLARAVFLSHNLALAMAGTGVALAVAKFWAFKRYAPALHLPRKLLAYGCLILLLNALAPLLFKNIANDLDLIKTWLDDIWYFVLPTLAGLGLVLPPPAARENSPGEKKWLPAAILLGWICVTACHFGGLGYANSYVWHWSLLIPVLWVGTWTLALRIQPYVSSLNRITEQTLWTLPLLVPLPAFHADYLLPTLAGLNLALYAGLFIRRHRNIPGFTRLLGAIAIFCGGLPIAWVGHLVPGVSQPEWAGLSLSLFAFWLIFRSRDPRLALFAALGLIFLSLTLAPALHRCAIQVALVSLLAHSLRWEDQRHKGAATLRLLAGLFWILISSAWLAQPTPSARWLVDPAASALLAVCLCRFWIIRQRKPLIVPICAVVVLCSEPILASTRWLGGASSGFIAILASFVLFALGSLAAFTKPKWWHAEPNRSEMDSHKLS